MNSNLDKIASDLYGKIQTRFKDIQIGDENAQTLSRKEDIPKARFFEFEYTEGGESLGTISITLDADDGIVVQISGDLVDDDDSTTHHGAYKFIRSFRQFARNRMLKFDADNIGKSNLDKRDYQFQAKRKEEPVMPQQPVMENKMYGNNKMSYQDLGENTRLVVKHSQQVNLEVAAGRTMHIESIYIENAQGERFRYPAKHLSGARALAEHIKHGGNPYDSIGKHITGLSEELAGLRKFKGYVSRQAQVSEAMGSVTDRVLERIDQIKETIAKLQRPAYYEAYVESFEEQDEQMIPEEIQNDLINRLTIRTFNEDLKAVLPYIYKFVDESTPATEIGFDEMLDETTGVTDYSPKSQGGTRQELLAKLKKSKSSSDATAARKAGASQKELQDAMKESIIDPEQAFEDFMESIVNEDKDELFSPNKDSKLRAIEKLNDVLSSELPGGPGGINAVESLKGLIDDPALYDIIKDLDPDLDTRPVIQQWLHDNMDKFAGDAAETIAMIQFGGPAGHEEIGGEDMGEPMPPEAAPEAMPPEPMPPEAGGMPPAAPAPAAPAAPAPGMPPAPIAESIMNALRKASKAGATLETSLDFGHGVKTIAEIIEECGCDAAEVGFEQPEEQGIPAMLKYISGFYNTETSNFPIGGTRMKIKVKKAWEDGEFGEVDQADVARIMQIIDKKDPSGPSQEQAHVIKLAGVAPQHNASPTAHLEKQMQGINPSDMMKAIMQKLNFGN